tara:strand:- start:313 stop:921 length:609 start_codon:yes stop_codon:yes gene_type:complete
MRIIFFSSNNFGVYYLNKMLDNNLNIVAGIPNKGDFLYRNSLKKNNIPIIEIPDFQDRSCLKKIKKYKPDLQIVCCFRIIPEYIFSYPRFKTINIHYSLLPSYRGAMPVEGVLLNNEKETGVSIHYISKKIDGGDIIGQKVVKIVKKDKLKLINSLNEEGIKLLLKVLKNIKDNKVIIIKSKYPEFYFSKPSFFKLFINGLL